MTGVESDLLSIGRMARETGLTASALRFYDGAGVLVPAMVDPVTGYRWYARRQVPTGRLVARLRRVGMPLADIAAVVRQWPNRGPVRRLLDAHLRRLVDGLADARRELSRVDALLTREEITMTEHSGPRTGRTVPAADGVRFVARVADLAAALRAVRFAVCTDPGLPMLCGVLFDLDTEAATGPVLRLVATDRYRLAVSSVPVTGTTGEPRAALAPVGFVDDVYALLARPAPGQEPGAEAVLTLAAGGIAVHGPGGRVDGVPADHDFPDYRRLLHRDPADRPVHSSTVEVARFRDALAAAEPRQVLREQDDVLCDVSVLNVDGGDVEVAGAGVGGAGCVGVNREFLLEALGAAGRDQLTLELDGPIRPLAVRVPDDAGTFSILMPVRLPEQVSYPG